MTMFTSDAPFNRASSENRALMAVDITGFSHNRSDNLQLWVRRSMYNLLEEAFNASAVAWNRSYHEDRGDGVLIVSPHGTVPELFIDPIYHWLASELQRHNRVSSGRARIQMRVALHIGKIGYDAHGVMGTALVHLFRLLDAPAFKKAHIEAGHDIDLIVSDYFYEEVLRYGLAMADPQDFRPLKVEFKETRARAWMYSPLTERTSAEIAPN
jgi:hypothetical protein